MLCGARRPENLFRLGRIISGQKNEQVLFTVTFVHAGTADRLFACLGVSERTFGELCGCAALLHATYGQLEKCVGAENVPGYGGVSSVPPRKEGAPAEDLESVKIAVPEHMLGKMYAVCGQDVVAD